MNVEFENFLRRLATLNGPPGNNVSILITENHMNTTNMFYFKILNNKLLVLINLQTHSKTLQQGPT